MHVRIKGNSSGSLGTFQPFKNVKTMARPTLLNSFCYRHTTQQKKESDIVQVTSHEPFPDFITGTRTMW